MMNVKFFIDFKANQYFKSIKFGIQLNINKICAKLVNVKRFLI